MAAPKTVKTYPLDGSGRDFEIPFEYLARKFVVVTLIGADRKVLVLNIDYRFTQRTIITLTRNWGPSEGYNFVEIKRVTSATERLVDFSDGSILRAADLNTATVQALHIAEEGRDIATDTIGVDNDGQLDARGRKIRNLADGTDDGDAVTVRQQKAWADSALNSRNAAKVSETNSKNSETNSKNSENASKNSENAAAQSRTLAENAQLNAGTHADTSVQYAGLSRQWASAGPGTVVADGMYSSLHYAGLSKSEAATSVQYAGLAVQHADRAKGEADRAKGEADKLGNANGLMATIESANSETNVVVWKGSHVWRTADLHMYSPTSSARLLLRTDGGSKWVGLSYNGANGSAYVTDSSGKTRQTWDVNGHTTIGGHAYVNGAVYAYGGSLQVNASSPTANAHVWMNDSSGAERALIYADSANRMHLRAKSSGNEWLLNAAGEFITSQGAYIAQNGNLFSGIYGATANLHGLLYAMAGPNARRVSSTLLWQGGGAAGTGTTITLADDAFNFSSFSTQYAGSAARGMVTGIRELADLPIGTQMYVTWAPNHWVRCVFKDTDPAQRRVLQTLEFAANSGFTAFFGHREYALL